MATIHQTTMTPSKLELLSSWLPRQPWYVAGGRPPRLSRVGGFRLDDPAGEVGIECMFVTDDATGTTYHVPMAYRGAPLPSGDAALIGTSEHGVLGPRWIYDGTRDPVVTAELVALLQGRTQPQAQTQSDTPDPSVTVEGGLPGTAAVVDTESETTVRLDGLVLRLPRRLVAGNEAHTAAAFVTAPWRMPDGSAVRGPVLLAER